MLIRNQMLSFQLQRIFLLFLDSHISHNFTNHIRRYNAISTCFFYWSIKMFLLFLNFTTSSFVMLPPSRWDSACSGENRLFMMIRIFAPKIANWLAINSIWLEKYNICDAILYSQAQCYNTIVCSVLTIPDMQPSYSTTIQSDCGTARW